MSKLVNICPKPYPKATTQGRGYRGLQEEAKVRKKKSCSLKKVLNYFFDNLITAVT